MRKGVAAAAPFTFNEARNPFSLTLPPGPRHSAAKQGNFLQGQRGTSAAKQRNLLQGMNNINCAVPKGFFPFPQFSSPDFVIFN